jgi:hypothetical protein
MEHFKVTGLPSTYGAETQKGQSCNRVVWDPAQCHINSVL